MFLSFLKPSNEQTILAVRYFNGIKKSKRYNSLPFPIQIGQYSRVWGESCSCPSPQVGSSGGIPRWEVAGPRWREQGHGVKEV